MKPKPTPSGITPPAPGLEKEEPEQGTEEDIGSQDDAPAGAKPASQDDGPLRDVERE